MIFPELALIKGTLTGLRRLRRLSRDDRIIPPHKMNLIAICRDNLFQDAGLLPAAAGGTTEVAVFNDGHFRGR